MNLLFVDSSSDINDTDKVTVSCKHLVDRVASGYLWL